MLCAMAGETSVGCLHAVDAALEQKRSCLRRALWSHRRCRRRCIHISSKMSRRGIPYDIKNLYINVGIISHWVQ